MANETITNRQAILDLIAQADETTEVAGLSASVTQLQIDVAGLSASIGNEINLGDFIVVDVPSGVATFSASASITSTVTDGTNTSTQIIIPTEINSSITDGTSTNSRTSEYDADTHFVSDGTGTQSTIVVQSGGITSTSTDGVNTTTIGSTPTTYSITTPTTLYSAQQSGDLELRADGSLTLWADYQANQNNIAIQSNQIVSTVGDGTNTTTQNIGPTGFDMTTTDGANSVAFVADYSQFNIELYDDNVGTTANIGVDTSQSSMGANDGTNTSTIITQPTSIQSTVTDGTRTSRLHLDPNQVSSSTKFETDDTTLQSGTGLVLNPDQSYQWGGDYNYSGTTYSENYVSGQEQYLSTITDNKISQITLDPASLNTGTLFKSEDLSVGSSAILTLGYDGQSSFDMLDGVGGSSNLTFTPTTILMSATDGSTFTSTLEIDPLEAGNFTNLSTSDGTTVNKLQVSQGDATLTSSIGGITQSSVITQPASIELTSTDGTNTSTTITQPTSIQSTVTDGTNVSIIELDPAGLVNGNRLYAEDGAGSSTTIGFNPTGTADFSGTDGVTIGSIAFGPVSANMMAYDQPNNFIYRVAVKSDDAEVKIEADYNASQFSNIIAKTQSIELTSTDGLTTNSIFIQPGITIFDGIPSYDDDAAAGTAGLTPGTLYQTTGLGASPLDVAGILMIKQ